MVVELRSFLQRVDDPYATSIVKNGVSFLHLEPVMAGDGVVGITIRVDEWYHNGKEIEVEDNKEIVGLCRIEIVEQHDGSTVTKVCSEGRGEVYKGPVDVAKVTHHDEL